MRRPAIGVPHGYNRYTAGCRCEVCRDGKAAYVREARSRRARARKLVQQHGTGGKNFVSGITHGIGGYTDFSCRCAVCVAAKSERDACQRKARLAVPNG